MDPIRLVLLYLHRCIPTTAVNNVSDFNQVDLAAYVLPLLLRLFFRCR